MLSQSGAILVAALGLSVLLGWVFNVAALKGGWSGQVTVKANTAICLMACGIGLALLGRAGPRLHTISRGLSILVVIVSSLQLLEYLFGIDLWVDQALFRDAVDAVHTVHPGRMAPVTAVNFLLCGIAIFLQVPTRTRRSSRFICWSALPVVFTASIAMVGYSYDIRSLYKVGPYTPMAVPTALAFLVLSLSLLVSDTGSGMVRLSVSESAGGIVIRRLLPTLPLTMFAVGWACLAGERAGFFDSQFHHALMVVLSIGISILVVTVTAAKLDVVDTKRRLAETELVALNADLERRVIERTKELENSRLEVKQISNLLPICAWCKKIRDDNDYWQTVEQYMATSTDARFTHGICPECRARLASDKDES